jgi:hypothetical protein
VQNHLNIPKFHSLLHYAQSITLFGSTDNYNTEQSEHLHINLIKKAYEVSNRKDKYPQMATWLEWCDKIQRHTVYMNWQQEPQPTNAPTLSRPIGPLQISTCYLKMARNPTMKATFGELAAKYGTINFQDLLADFIAQVNYPGASTAVLCTRAADTLIPFQTVPDFH